MKLILFGDVKLGRGAKRWFGEWWGSQVYRRNSVGLYLARGWKEIKRGEALALRPDGSWLSRSEGMEQATGARRWEGEWRGGHASLQRQVFSKEKSQMFIEAEHSNDCPGVTT